MVGGNLAMINAKPNAKVNSITEKAELFVTVHDDTFMMKNLGFDDIIAESQEPKYQKTALTKSFILPEVEGEKTLHPAFENNREIRTEDRFVYKTQISFKKNIKSPCFNAETVNISSKGLCISVKSAEELEKGEEILITFDALNGRLKEKIIEQPYKIMNINRLNVHLMASGTIKNNFARKAMTRLIYNNLDKLKPTGVKDKIYGLSKAMRSIYSQNHINIPFFLSREKRQNFVETVLVNKISEISNLKEQQDILNLMSSPSFLTFSNRLFADLDEENSNSEGYVILLPKIRLKSGTEKLYWIKDLNEIFDNENGIEFIQKIKAADNPAILKIRLRKPGEENRRYYSDELAYLRRLNQDMTESLDNYVNDMIAVGELSEITSIVLDKIEAMTEEKEKVA